jgi:hypothetical protein
MSATNANISLIIASTERRAATAATITKAAATPTAEARGVNDLKVSHGVLLMAA